MADYLEEWTAQAGTGNFSADPPNATLSVYEEGKPDNTLFIDCIGVVVGVGFHGIGVGARSPGVL